MRTDNSIIQFMLVFDKQSERQNQYCSYELFLCRWYQVQCTPECIKYTKVQNIVHNTPPPPPSMAGVTPPSPITNQAKPAVGRKGGRERSQKASEERLWLSFLFTAAQCSVFACADYPLYSTTEEIKRKEFESTEGHWNAKVWFKLRYCTVRNFVQSKQISL